jgi:UbiD family decarboxylase
MVPAESEIIIEGEVLPGEFADEGPFGEFAGYMGPVAKKPLVRITAITHRKDAIYYGYSSQMPPSESTVLQSLTNGPLVLKILREDMGDKNVKDVHIDLTFGGLLAHCMVSMTPQNEGHAKKIGRLVADMTPLKRVTVVDDDVDIRDPLHMEWAMNSHYHPARDTIIIDDVYFPMGMDPSVRIDNQMQDMGSKVVIDATRTIDAGEYSLPPKEIMMKALDLWQEVGLPEFDIPKRAQFRIDRS